jgi:protein-tyrosine phosphatase
VTWAPGTPGVLVLPSGRRIRGRGLGRPLPEGLRPEFAVYLLGHQPADMGWPSRWVQWPDFRLPKDKVDAAEAFAEALRRSETERVEVACHGGRGRTGTALACIAVLDGVPAAEAVAFVRQGFDRHAVETPWQSRFVRHFPRS